MKWVAILAQILAALLRGFLGQKSETKAQQVSGEMAAENEIQQAAAERGKNAQKNADTVAGLSDDELDRLLVSDGKQPPPAG